ncbi:Uncharacterized protein SCG7109_AB_00480 [Chlamydiales bacterium SCGC AG-110-M15]|nr:Uncharacterized protein SCG7109_AB_00480 [Chlamydiales bacterium SCGC AG-110-M15]
MKRILHTEASPGWGGQEIRILREAEGLRDRGFEIYFAVNEEGALVEKLREAGFHVYPVPFARSQAIQTCFHLLRIIRRHNIELINTHSSLDAWVGGFVGRLAGVKIVRTRHLSTPIRPGLNSVALYRWFADKVATTCEATAQLIRKQAHLDEQRCMSVPTGVNTEKVQVRAEAAMEFREKFGIAPTDCVVGTTCILRTWKGVADLLQAAKLLQNEKHIKWLIVGGGVSEAYFRDLWETLELQDTVFFSGHIDNPFPAIAAMDIFSLLSTGNEGVSQASLQAAFLKKPLITTRVGGLPEVCVHHHTGYCVNTHSPREVATMVKRLAGNPIQRERMGENAKQLVLDKFTLEKTLNEMEVLYQG